MNKLKNKLLLGHPVLTEEGGGGARRGRRMEKLMPSLHCMMPAGRDAEEEDAEDALRFFSQ